MGRLPKWLRRTLFALLVLAVLYAGASIWIGAVANARIAKEIEAIRARGEPLELIEMAPPPVADADNAAIPLLAAEEAYVESFEGEMDFDAVERFIDAPFDSPEADLAAGREWLAANAEALGHVEEALGRPACRFDFDYDDPLSAPDPSFTALMNASRLLRTHAFLAAREGRTAEASAGMLDAFRLERLAGPAPTLIAFMVKVVTGDRALDGLQELRKRGLFDPAHAPEWVAALDSVRVGDDFHTAMLGERCFGHRVFPMVLAGDVNAGLDGIPDFLAITLPGGVFRLDHAWYLARMRELVRLAGSPWFEAKDDWAAHEAAVGDRPWYAMVSSMTMVTFARIAEKAEAYRARLDLARLVLTADGTTGLPPPPEGTERGTTDPFTGLPYEFERTEAGFRIRSAGPPDGDPEGRLTWE